MAKKKDSDQKEKPRIIDFQFPFFLVRIRAFLGLIERLGAFRLFRKLAWLAVGSMPVIGGFSFYLILLTLYGLLTVPAAREATRALGPQANILLPGITPYLPFFYGLIGIIVAVIIHEGAHGVIARSVGFRVKSSGLLLFLIVPVGAFVDLDEEELKEARTRDSLRVMAAGPGANITAALVCLGGVLILVSGLTPVIDGLYVAGVVEGLPAESAGILEGDVITMVENRTVLTFDDFGTVIKDKDPGDVVLVTVARGNQWEDTLTIPTEIVEQEGKLVLGIFMGEMHVEERLKIYLTPSQGTLFLYFLPPTLTLVPFSDFLTPYYMHPIGSGWVWLTKILYWVWFININVAIFNSLPILPLDGGRAFKGLLKSFLGKTNETLVSRLSTIVTISTISILVMIFVVPYIL